MFWAAACGGHGAISKRRRMRRCVYRQSMKRWWQARVTAGGSTVAVVPRLLTGQMKQIGRDLRQSDFYPNRVSMLRTRLQIELGLLCGFGGRMEVMSCNVSFQIDPLL